MSVAETFLESFKAHTATGIPGLLPSSHTSLLPAAQPLSLPCCSFYACCLFTNHDSGVPSRGVLLSGDIGCIWDSFFLVVALKGALGAATSIRWRKPEMLLNILNAQDSPTSGNHRAKMSLTAAEKSRGRAKGSRLCSEVPSAGNLP